jgi:hypothetical protein
MPQGLRKMQANFKHSKKQFKRKKIMSTISNFVSCCNHQRRWCWSYQFKIQKELLRYLLCCKVCRTLSLEGIEDLAEDNLNKARVNNKSNCQRRSVYTNYDAKFKFDQAASDLSDHKQDIEFLKRAWKR